MPDLVLSGERCVHLPYEEFKSTQRASKPVTMGFCLVIVPFSLSHLGFIQHCSTAPFLISHAVFAQLPTVDRSPDIALCLGLNGRGMLGHPTVEIHRSDQLAC